MSQKIVYPGNFSQSFYTLHTLLLSVSKSCNNRNFSTHPFAKYFPQQRSLYKSNYFFNPLKIIFFKKMEEDLFYFFP